MVFPLLTAEALLCNKQLNLAHKPRCLQATDLFPDGLSNT